ncbi:uncharacterized protein LOC110229748 [Arabidopsis lyrata subsp. lyrata]|uniref:uncharacterized protein LOC110229748 n=1 Tax=Arabidopsis lyrata subsp. lyrata TaxID=81972 RepID=UPI000A29A9BE|nr:uncharacterized protein LOC110229748 [Arabidopsis lyrata subsp. lyrata]|eukprot:XP_020886212.1 uncharacterized protein LOC110229748 [Arabidopsis lyrata subsp. lyrata]
MSMADKELWISLQNLNLGLEHSPLKISNDAKNRRDAEHRLSLVVQGLHPSQNPAGIKVMMPKIWKLEGRVTSRINDDGSVQFFFRHEHQLLTVLDNGPWTYKDWLVVVDRWTRRNYPDFLRIIRFWVKILNLPDDSKSDSVIREVGGVLGHVDEVHIQQPSADQVGEVRVRVPIDVDDRLLFARYFNLDDSRPPVLIRFVYDKLRRFCSTCGGLNHLATHCNFQVQEAEHLQLPPPIPVPVAHHMVDQPYTPTEGANDTMGETVGSNLNMEVSENQDQNNSQGEDMEFTHPSEVQDTVNAIFEIQEMGVGSVFGQNRGTKRKVNDSADAEQASTSNKRIQGEVDTPKPPSPE